jgi:hypothetical protein
VGVSYSDHYVEQVIRGNSHGEGAFNALIHGPFAYGKPVYVARTRNGFTTSSRAELLLMLKPWEIPDSVRKLT